jgi:uncharacterized protein involved in exopolysaccharide biosynthesis
MNAQPENTGVSESPDSVAAAFVALVWRGRWIIGGTFFIVVTVVTIAVFVMKSSFTARTSFMPPPDDGGGVSSFLRDPLSAVLKRGGGASLDRLASFLNSQTTRGILVERYGLQAHYKALTKTEAMLGLEQLTTVVVTTEGSIDVAVTDRDPGLAASIANTYTELVDSLFRDAETTHARQTREFLKRRLDENLLALAAAESSAKAFSLQYGVVALPEQVASLVDLMAGVEGQIMAVDVKIGSARQVLGPAHFSLRELTSEREQLVAQRRALIETRGKGTSDPLFAFKEVPERALQYARLEREIKIQTIIQELVMQQYEMAKLQEQRDVASLTIIDRATTPEIRSWPRRGRIIILSAAVSLVWGILLAYALEELPRLRRKVREVNERRRSRAGA